MVTRLKYIQSVMFSTFGKLFQDATAEDSDLQHFTDYFPQLPEGRCDLALLELWFYV